MAPRRPFLLAGIRFEAFPVIHSLRAPAVGYRIGGAGAALFYVPDVLAIPRRAAALRNVDLYVGDGAALLRPIVHHSVGGSVGHASMRSQLDWCTSEGVSRAIFTHCGSEIVRGEGRRLKAQLTAMASARGLTAARLAHDGLKLEWPLQAVAAG